MQDPLLFALAVLFVLGTPGPTNTLLATSGATVGFRRSLPLVPAEAAGYLIAILTLGLVLGPAVAASPALAVALRAAVGAYLLALAWRLWRTRVVIAGERVVAPRQIFVTTLLNPKAIVFALGVVPFGAGVPVWPYMLGFLALLVGVALAWIALGAGVGRAAEGRGWLAAVPRAGAVAVAFFAVVIVAQPFLG